MRIAKDKIKFYCNMIDTIHSNYRVNWKQFHTYANLKFFRISTSEQGHMNPQLRRHQPTPQKYQDWCVGAVNGQTATSCIQIICTF